MDDFKGAQIDPNIKPKYFDNPNNEFKDINMQHILDKHTLEHFDFNKPENIGSTVHMFKPGTSQQQVCDYIDLSLKKLTLSRNGRFPLNDNASKIILNKEYKVIIGSRKLPNGDRIIGQFYPASGNSVVKFTKTELLAIKKILY